MEHLIRARLSPVNAQCHATQYIVPKCMYYVSAVRSMKYQLCFGWGIIFDCGSAKHSCNNFDKLKGVL